MPPSSRWVSVPNSFISLFVFYILSYLLLKRMGCLSGCLVSSTSIQKLFCGSCSAFKWSFDEFVEEDSGLPVLFLCHLPKDLKRCFKRENLSFTCILLSLQCDVWRQGPAWLLWHDLVTTITDKHWNKCMLNESVIKWMNTRIHETQTGSQYTDGLRTSDSAELFVILHAQIVCHKNQDSYVRQH